MEGKGREGEGAEGGGEKGRRKREEKGRERKGKGETHHLNPNLLLVPLYAGILEEQW